MWLLEKLHQLKSMQSVEVIDKHMLHGDTQVELEPWAEFLRACARAVPGHPLHAFTEPTDADSSANATTAPAHIEPRQQDAMADIVARLIAAGNIHRAHMFCQQYGFSSPLLARVRIALFVCQV
jgi:hypothetical protein